MANGNMKVTLEGQPDHFDALLGLGQPPEARPAPSGSPVLSVPSLGMVPGINRSTIANLPTVSRPSGAMPMVSPAGPETYTPQVPTGGESTLGKVGHVLGEIGQVAGSALIPGVMPWIPGTEQHNIMEDRLAEWKKAAGENLEHRRAETGELSARSEEERARAKALGEGTGTGAEATVESGGQAYEWNPETSRYDIPIGTPKSEKPTAQEFQPKWIKGPDGKPIPANFNPHTGKYTDLQGNEIANPVPVEKAPTEAKPVAGMEDGKPAWGQYDQTKGWTDPQTGQALPSFRPPPTFAETGLWQPIMLNTPEGKIVPGRFNARTGQAEPLKPGSGIVIPKETQGEINKALTTARGSDTRYRVMIDNEQPALSGNQQAMLNVLANHIGMTMGLQKGARITQAVWDEAQQTAPFLQRVTARFDKQGYLSGVTLSPEQIKQMVELGYDRRVREWQQAHDTAVQNGLDISGTMPEDVRKALGTAGETGTVTQTTPGGAGQPAVGAANPISDAIKAFREKKAK